MSPSVQLGASPVGAPSSGRASTSNGNLAFQRRRCHGGDFDVSTGSRRPATRPAPPASIGRTSTTSSPPRPRAAFRSSSTSTTTTILGSAVTTPPNSIAQLKAYGQFLGKRYVHFDNIIWMIGNDYSESSGGVQNLGAVIQGIRQYDTRHVGWAFDEYGAAFDNTGLRSDLRLNTIYEYSAGPWRTLYLGQYNRADFGPIMNIEAGYENTSSLGVGNADVRNEHYSFLLNGATGDTYGNEYVWPFADSWQSWQDALTSQGAHEVTYFAKLVNSIPWSEARPRSGRHRVPGRRRAGGLFGGLFEGREARARLSAVHRARLADLRRQDEPLPRPGEGALVPIRPRALIRNSAASRIRGCTRSTRRA